MKSILHRDFKYTSSASTDIRKTIRKEQKRLAEIAARQAESDAAIRSERAVVVAELPRKVKS